MVVRAKELDLCEQELLWTCAGSTHAETTLQHVSPLPRGLQELQAALPGLYDPKEITDPLKGKPKASSYASHATTSTWFLTPHLAPFQLY